MKSISYLIIVLFLTSISLNSCQNSTETADKVTTDSKEINKKDASKVVMAIDSNAINVVKRNNTDFKVTKDEKPATAGEINAMISSQSKTNLNEYQKVVQAFLKGCSTKDYNAVAKLLVYNGADVKRKLSDHYIMTNPSEKQIVTSTVDVVYGFLEESKNYEFITYSEKSTAIGQYAAMEVSFFKKGMGINRREFDVADTPKGKLIVDMR